MLDNKYQLNTEDLLTNDFSSSIHDFWQQHAFFSNFESECGGTINTVSINTGQLNAIVISQGRNESVLKYKELAFDLHKQGYDIFLIDHRGQGFSSRLGGDAHRGHVEAFEDYVTDLNTFVTSLALPQHYHSCFLLAHSMGSAISALYLQQYLHPFNAVAFFSPMFTINLGAMPTAVAKVVSRVGDLISNYFSESACYALGFGPYSKHPFEKNNLTSSTKRYHSVLNSFEYSPETQLGGPTMRWVNESLFAIEKAVNNAALITVPTLVIQSGADQIVSAKGQLDFCANRDRHNDTQFMRIENAKHELLLEKDEYRIPAINAALDFFQLYQQGKLPCIK